MKVEERDGGAERQVIISCITSTEFLARTAGRLPREPFRSKQVNTLYKLCKDHYGKYQQAPQGNILLLFEEWASTNKDRESHSVINRLLASLSGEYEQGVSSLDFSLDLAERHFNAVLLERLQEELRLKMDNGDCEAALKEINSFALKKVCLKGDPYINLLEDMAAHREALEKKQNVLIQYPGDAGKFFGTELAEDSFVGIMAQAKGSKSYTLLDMAWRAVKQGRKVAYFQVGDLSRDQILRRFQRRVLYRPLSMGLVRMPIGIKMSPEGDIADVEWEPKEYSQDLSRAELDRGFQRVQKKVKETTGGELRLSRHPTKGIGVDGIKGILDGWDREGWVSNVCVIDYAGNLAAMDAKMAVHEQVGYTWAMLRQLSEMRKCLVVTANQTNKEGFKAYVLTRSNFRDSLMILAHVTCFLGINFTSEEKSRGILRYNYIASREGELSEVQCLHTASCLAVANPFVRSIFP